MRRRAVRVALALGLVVSAASAETASPECLRATEIEAELAKRPTLYLRLDVDALRLEVRVRGTTLTEVPVLEASRLVFSGVVVGRGKTPALVAPALWTVVEGPGDTDRETIAPTTLRPYSEDEEEPTTSGPAKPKTDAEKPSSYRVELDSGWQLFLVNEPPKLNWFRRFGAAIRDGWQRLQGEEPSHPPLIALVVAPADAQRLHHLFRTGMPILVTRGGC